MRSSRSARLWVEGAVGCVYSVGLREQAWNPFARNDPTARLAPADRTHTAHRLLNPSLRYALDSASLDMIALTVRRTRPAADRVHSARPQARENVWPAAGAGARGL